MIIDGLIYIVFGLIGIFLSLLPIADSVTIAEINNNLAGFRTAMASSAWIFPVDLFFKFLGIIITIESAVLTFKVIKWIVSNITLGLVKTQ